jgi:regulator of replication initiation timing
MTMENTGPEQQPTPEHATTMSDLQQQLDELKRNIDREVTRRVKNTIHSNADLKIEVRNLRAEVTDLRASNKAAIGERDKLHGELVEVRAALADVSAERDSLRTTLANWEAADTAPFVKVPDVADHVVPPVLPMCTTCHGCGSVLYPSPAGDYLCCGNVRCTRSNTKHWRPGCTIGPYAGPCKSPHHARHE